MKNKLLIVVFISALIISQLALFITGAYADASDGGYLSVIIGVPFIFSGIVTLIIHTLHWD
ncbi:hypothetical protein TDB9533_00678 [Thalassocella blandensis]|nr:hypothetical protein TDB9533_00678 [Thalassocella blandensis]